MRLFVAKFSRAAVRACCCARLRRTADAPNLPPDIVGLRGFNSSTILILRVGILMSIGNLPESWSQAMLVGTMLVWRLGVIADRLHIRAYCLCSVLSLRHPSRLCSDCRAAPVVCLALA